MTFNSHIIKRDMTTIKIKTITMIHNTNNMAIITIKEIIRIMTNTKIMMVNMIMKGNTITTDKKEITIILKIKVYIFIILMNLF